MGVSSPGATWKKGDVATGFIEDRRKLIPLFEVQEELTKRLIRGSGREIRRFVDLGAGDGDFTELVMDLYPESSCIMVDFSEPMIDAAEERLAAKRDRWEYMRADLSTPTWLDAIPSGERYDAVVSRLTIHHLPDDRKRALYRESFDLLEPGGLFLNWEHVATGGLAEGLFDEYFRERMLEAELERPDPRPPEEVMRAYDDAHDDDILCDPEIQCEWLREIGFERVDVYFKVPELAIFGGVKGRYEKRRP
jgi:tRNA (cmo5U34)-methyltransferase